MRDENQVWTISWTQPYVNWNEPEFKQEQEQEEVLDLTQAREVLARIMSK